MVWDSQNCKQTDVCTSFADIMSEEMALEIQRQDTPNTSNDELIALELQQKFNQEFHIHEEKENEENEENGEDHSYEWECESDCEEDFIIANFGGKKTVGRKNASKPMKLKPIHKGEDEITDMGLPSRVYNHLKAFSRSSEKQTMKLTDKTEKATSTLALDPRSLLMLLKMVDNNKLESLSGVVSTGKEAVILHALGGATEDLTVPEECAIKVFKTTLNEFKTRDKYIAQDYRFRNRFSKQNPRQIIHMWAEKEFHNLRRMRRARLNCPEVVLLKNHILVMSFIGTNGNPAPKIRDASLTTEEANLAYKQTVSMMQTLYRQCRLIHGDLSEYNILWHGGQCWYIDVSQAVEPTHPNALEFLYRDCCNVYNFFGRRGVEHVVQPEQLFSSITGFQLGEQDQINYIH